LKKRLSAPELAGVVAIILLLLSVVTYANYRYTSQNPGGNDFLSRWVGTRLFLTRGSSPYGEQATRQIHELAYGREAQPGEDQMLFAYPFYSVVIVAPFALIAEYSLARAIWMTALEIALIVIAFTGLSLSRWKPSIWLLSFLLIFSLLWYYGLRPVINGNLAIVVALLIGLTLLAINAELDALAGFLIALASIKPQMVVLLIPLLCVWTISHRRWSFIGSFLGSLALLIAGFSLFIPDWLVQNLRQVLSYPTYTLPSTTQAIIANWLPGVGRQVGWGITILMMILLLVEWRAVIGKEFRWLLWTTCLTLVITNLIGIQTATENYVAMFMALVLVFAVWEERWWRYGRWLVLVTMLFLLFGVWSLFVRTLQVGDQPIQHPIMFIIYPVFLLLSLYWVRWWAIRPPRLFVEQFFDVRGAT